MLPSVLPTETDHVPVLADEVVALLDPKPGETVVDATFGAGGHASLLAARLRGDGKLIAIDRDPTVATFFERFRRGTAAKTRLLHGEFSTVLEQLAENGVKADAILLDLGVSSMQLDRPERGFSYAVDAPLDMRMDPSADVTAADIVNGTDERELASIFHRYGEERYARQIARAIVKRRATEPFERTGELVDIIKASIPAPARFGEGHPAKRVFQALRIEVNDELGAVERALPATEEMLRPGGRLAVIAFHSLEDRIVKRYLRNAEHGCTCPPDFPVCACGSQPTMRATPRRAVRPSAS
jgi:16S rRNA (cytosine1402-N4)-methyltransferase